MRGRSRPRSTGTHRLRVGRRSLANQIYHVTTATLDRQPIFNDIYAGRAFVRALMREESVNAVQTMAYVVMPDHIHWLCQLPERRDLYKSVNNIKSVSARNINHAIGHHGSVWQKGFFDRALRSSDDVVSVARYIVANPLRAGIAGDIGQYALWDAVWVDAGFDL